MPSEFEVSDIDIMELFAPRRPIIVYSIPLSRTVCPMGSVPFRTFVTKVLSTMQTYVLPSASDALKILPSSSMLEFLWK